MGYYCRTWTLLSMDTEYWDIWHHLLLYLQTSWAYLVVDAYFFAFPSIIECLGKSYTVPSPSCKPIRSFGPRVIFVTSYPAILGTIALESPMVVLSMHRKENVYMLLPLILIIFYVQLGTRGWIIQRKYDLMRATKLILVIMGILCWNAIDCLWDIGGSSTNNGAKIESSCVIELNVVDMEECFVTFGFHWESFM